MSIQPSYVRSVVSKQTSTPENTNGWRRSKNGRAPCGGGRGAEILPIIAICHLSWDWVWQRPQQFLSRLAKTHPLLFVETHRSEVRTGYIEVTQDVNNPALRIAKVHLPAHRWCDGAFIDRERRRLLQEWLSTAGEGEFDGAILWFNDPMAVTAYAGHLGECMIVYDCMDELSQFSGAPPELIQREWELVEAADVIFCGGQKMRAKRLPYNPNTHFFGTGVDCDHFGQACCGRALLPPEIAGLKGPVLGYFGVIDERIDYELLSALAMANPRWNIVMVGPTAKVDVSLLPRHENIHWIGPRAYADLPALTAGMHVCMMPFALNAATEFINPTKALEYMAAGKPVVSTALDEVRLNSGEVAWIAHDHEEFIDHCRNQVQAPSRERIELGQQLARANTWESIVHRMQLHLDNVIQGRGQRVTSRAWGLCSGGEHV
jgi:glycosyltransferase involved in cell wall biosynthesis